jgi:RNA polymerase sigma-70 factor (ECF subfamily)
VIRSEAKIRIERGKIAEAQASGMQGREVQWAADMRAAQAGCASAYVRLLTGVSASFRQFAVADLRRFYLQPDDVEDILQEVLLAIHLKRHTWRPDRPFIPWLRAITRHKLVDFARRRSRRGELPIENFPDIFPAPTEEPDVLAPIQQLVGDLPQRQRQVIEEVALAGASVADTALKLNMSRGAVYVAFHRALGALTAKLER